MLARTYRLRKNSDFQRLYKTANSQVGFVVSKKISKSAVVRNTLRRRASGIVEDMFNDIKEPTKIIILIRRDFSGIKPSELQDEIKKLLERLTV